MGKNFLAMTALTIIASMLLMLCMGCDEGMQMVDDVVTEPVETTEPTKPATSEPTDPVAEMPTTTGDMKKPEPTKPADTNPEEPEPTPTVTIAAVVQADDKSITISGTSTHVPEGTTVTIVLGDDAITVKTTVDKDGAWSATVSAKNTAQLAPGTIAVKATARKVTAESSFEIAPEPETKEPELQPSDTTAPTVVRVGWYSDNRLRRLMYNDRQPGVTVYVKVVFSEPVEHIVGDNASARPALSLVVGGRTTRLRVLPHNTKNKDFVSGTCKPFEESTDTFACSYTIPAEGIGTVELQVGEETADTAGNAIAESYHAAPFMIEAPAPPPLPVVPIEVVPALKTLVPATSQDHLPPPQSGPGDFVGQVRTLYSTNGISVNSTQPIAGVSVTITDGAMTGEQVTTDQGGYYLFQNVNESELYLRIEKEHFEPKEVIVYRTRPTVLQEQTGPMLDRGDPWNTPGTVVIGQRWPDAIRFIFEETLLPNDLLFVRDDGYKSHERAIGQYYWSGRLSGIVAISVSRIRVNHIMMMFFAHELGHAHQHAVSIVNNTDTWGETPEGRAYARARERDWAEVGRSALDQFIDNYPEGARFPEGAAEVSSLYWGRGMWSERTEISSVYWRINNEPKKADLETTAPNRYQWAEEWLNKR